MSKDISLKSIKIIPKLKKYAAKYHKHAAFAALIVVLLVYVLVMLKINLLANAEPTPDQQQVITSSVPRIDPNAVKQIQNLENNNTDVHSLFEQARNNPFSE